MLVVLLDRMDDHHTTAACYTRQGIAGNIEFNDMYPTAKPCGRGIMFRLQYGCVGRQFVLIWEYHQKLHMQCRLQVGLCGGAELNR